MSMGTSWREKIIFLVSILFPLFAIFNAFLRPLPLHQERVFFFGLIIVLTLLFRPLKSKGPVVGKIYVVVDLVLTMAIIVCAGYVFVNWRYIVWHLGITSPIDIAMGITATLIVLEATRRTMLPFVPVCLAFLLYAFFGQHIPGIMQAAPTTISRLIQDMWLSTDGMYGICLSAALSYILPFLIMGCLLKAMGAMDVLNDLTNILVGRTVGGPAKISVITSGMFGTMSGSAVANVAFTGTFTIPLMKRYGYKPEFAGAVEASASTGGQLTPPIMGAAAFIMAEYTGIPYLQICIAAILPCLLYYTAIFLRVHYKAKQEGLQKPSVDIVGRISSLKEIIPRVMPLAIVFAVLIIALVRWTPTYAAVLAIAVIIPVSFLRRETWMTPSKLIAGLRDATQSFLSIGPAVLAIGMLMVVAMRTGLGLKFSELMLIASGQSLLLLLLVTSLALLIMGMGVGGIAVYMFGAIMIGPAMIKLGVPILLAHFFIFYWSNIQCITPPVCLASYTAASIARASPTKTALTACSVGIMAWVIPLLFAFNPELLLLGSPLGQAVGTFLLMLCGLVALTFGLGGYLNRQLSLLERLLLSLAAVAIFAGANYAFTIAGLVLTVVLILFSIIIKRRSQKTQTVV